MLAVLLSTLAQAEPEDCRSFRRVRSLAQARGIALGAAFEQLERDVCGSGGAVEERPWDQSSSEDCKDLAVMTLMAEVTAAPSQPTVARLATVVCAADSAQGRYDWPGGTTARYGSTWYWPDGSTAKYGSTWYWPNGTTARYSGNWQWPNGATARSGSIWMHPNGQSAASLAEVLNVACQKVDLQRCAAAARRIRQGESDLAVLEVMKIAWRP